MKLKTEVGESQAMQSGRLNLVHRSRDHRPGLVMGGEVATDFINLEIGGLLAGIFNVADRCITIGVVVFFLETCRLRCWLYSA